MHNRTLAFRQPESWNLKQLAYSQGMNLSELFRTAIEEYCQRRGIKITKP